MLKEENKIAEEKKAFGKKGAIIGISGTILVIFLAVFVWLSQAVNAYDKIFPNITAGGVEIGGVTKAEAVKILEAEFKEKTEGKTFNLTLEDKVHEFKAEDIEAKADIEKTVQEAYDYGKKGNILKRITRYIKSKGEAYEIPVYSELNEEITLEMLDFIAKDCETPVKETEFTINKNILTLTKGHDGIQLDREKAKKEIKESIFSKGKNVIALKLEEATPKKVDLDELYKKITQGKKNAVYARENGEIVVKDGFPKVEMSKIALKTALDSEEESYDIKVVATEPEITGEELREKLFRDEMGSWTSYFSGGNVSRSSNVKLSASRINGISLLPGETFSYDETIGPRTAANGYKTATVYVGNKQEDGIGGGICQTSSTLYSAVLYANLEIVSRTSHSLPVSYMPPGQDATIAEGYIDFKFKNNTDYPVKIICETTYGSVTCRIMGVKPKGETVTVINTRTSTLEPKNTRTLNPEIPVGYKIITEEGQQGYTVSSQRVVSVDGVEQKRENLTKSVYRAQDIVEEVNPLDKDTPSESLKLYDESNISEEGTSPEPEDTEGNEAGEESPVKNEESESTGEMEEETESEPEPEGGLPEPAQPEE